MVRFQTMNSIMVRTSPLRWGFDKWAAIVGVTGCVILVLAVLLCLVSFSVPPPGIALAGVSLSFVVGVVLSVTFAFLFWLIGAFVRLLWRSQ